MFWYSGFGSIVYVGCVDTGVATRLVKGVDFISEKVKSDRNEMWTRINNDKDS